ncbi:MAG TPA: DcaP family trimeric outer membrane transporter [Kofleriaceae bacterium]|nr:DcaP family trimeric outer membrane transporter [Kofleriaceae bacterium]
MTDSGVAFGDVGNPDWFDVLRPSKLPSFEDEFGESPRTFLSARQTRFGVKTKTPVRWGSLDTIFEWELFGVGVDAGQTTFRLRHAYGELGQLGAGQTWSPFMDIDVFPNSIEYWGPSGMVFFRNVQMRWMPIKGDSRVTVALERPGADADVGGFAETVELAGVVERTPVPDLSAEARWGGPWGYVELAGILRYLAWGETTGPDLSDHAIGWGLNLSSNLKYRGHVLRLAAVYGEGIQSYMNDAPADVGIEIDPTEPGGVKGVALPILTGVAFLDLKWNDLMTSSIGWSGVWIDNSDGQLPSAYHSGHYALANLLFQPFDNLMFGPEVQYGHRSNAEDDFTADEFRVQFSARFKYSKTIGGK